MYSDFEYEDDLELEEHDEDAASIHLDDMYQCRASQIGWR